jgi:hypothetical protein
MENYQLKKLSGMKKNIYSRIFKIGLLFLMIIIAGSSCVKSRPGETVFTGLGPTVLIPEGGLQNLGSDAILFPPTDNVDTTWFHVNYAATNVAPVDEVVTLAIDPNALAAYNAMGGGQYAIFPDSIFSFTTTTVTVPKGQNYTVPIPLIIFPSKIDLLNNYMLPISITVAPAGATISSNFQTIYYHLIGNPIAGLYLWDFTRWNNTSPTGPNSGSFTGNPAVFAPLDGTTIEVPSGYFIQPRYKLTFTDSAGIPINFQLAFDPADLAALSADGVTVVSGPNIITADPINGIYEFQYQTASPRYVIDKYYK